MDKELMREDMKVEVFSTRDPAKLQFSMNTFLTENPDIDVLELEYAQVCDNNGDILFSALMLYK